MEQLLDYYNFSSFTKDTSLFFKTIAYSHIKDDLYLVIEKKSENYTIHFTSYADVSKIGKEKPEGLNTLIEDFKIDNNEHRKIIQQYLDYN